MQNVVSLRSDRPRPQRMFGVPRSGARILFFTGVRYCRDEIHDDARDDAGRPGAVEEGRGAKRGIASAHGLDATAH